MTVRGLGAMAAAVFISLVAPSQLAFGGDNEGAKNYSAAEIRNFELAGLKLGMSADDAAAAMKAAGYRGSYRSEVDDRAKAWENFDRAIFPFRYIEMDGSVKLSRIEYLQTFEESMSVEGLKAKLIEKYGPPSRFDNATGVYVWESELTLPPNGAAMGCVASGDPNCWRIVLINSGFKTAAEYEAALLAQMRRPELRASIKPKELNIVLSDEERRYAAEQLRNKAAKESEEEKRRNATKKIELGL